VPDADDTPGALLALDACRRSAVISEQLRQQIDEAAVLGVRWLLGLQNRDGGWPTFCRGWGALPFDRSGADLTAHSLRAVRAWSDRLPADLQRQWSRAEPRAWRYLEQQQRRDGAWVPLWFGNQDDPAEENPIYGTAKVLEAYLSAGRAESSAAQRGWNWLCQRQNDDGGWGGSAAGSSVEETALAVHSLAGVARPLQSSGDSSVDRAFRRGLCWLIHQTEGGGVRMCSPIGFYFAKLWYYEKLYPLVFTLGALGRVRGRR
jgi:squalene-hopene/tetraprenyl-beta-curcumene cyclase